MRLVSVRSRVQVPAGASKIHSAISLMDSLEVKHQVESLKIGRSNRPLPIKRYLVKNDKAYTANYFG